MNEELDCSEKLDLAESTYESGDMDLAISIFKDLAGNGVAEACQYLGLIYRTGDGVDKSNSLSRCWYSRYVSILTTRSESGCCSAAYELAGLYRYGEHVQQDEGKALKMFVALAEGGFAGAQYALASFFLNGWCRCEVDNLKYEFWLEKSAVAGHPEAMYYYGKKLIDRGEVDLGRRFLLESADNGFWIAKDYFSAAHEG